MSPRDAVGEISPELGLARAVRRRPKLSWSMRIGAGVLIFYVAVALISVVWTPYDPLTPGIGDGYDAPSSAFPLGTDRLGADMLSRLMAGARYNLGITLTAVAIAFCVGTTIGVIAGYYGGTIDTVALRAVEIFQAFPGLLFAMLVVQAVGAGIVNVILVMSFVGIPDYLRLARGEIQSRRSWQYAEAARMVGNPPWRVAFRHLLPNSIGPLLAFTSINAAFVALITASLGLPGPWARSEHAGMGQHDRPRPGWRDDRPVVGLVLPRLGDPGPHRRVLPSGRCHLRPHRPRRRR